MKTDEDLIRAALEAAAAAGPRDVPIGAVIVAADGTELARAANMAMGSRAIRSPSELNLTETLNSPRL